MEILLKFPTRGLHRNLSRNFPQNTKYVKDREQHSKAVIVKCFKRTKQPLRHAVDTQLKGRGEGNPEV